MADPGRRRAPVAVLLARAVAGVTALMILAATGAAWYAYHALADGLQRSSALDQARQGAPRHLDASVNLLLIGLDSRKDMNGNDLPKQFVEDELHAGSSDIGGYNTNTLILMHIPANGGQVTAFSIPRDDYVTDPVDGRQHKIKEAYGLAKADAENTLRAHGMTDPVQLEHESRDAGRAATLRTVQDFLGVPIDHFAEVNLLGFYDIAKALGPITVCLNNPVQDDYSGADFPAGVQKLDPAQALAFVRQRHGLTNGDLDRTHRQQAFLSGVVENLKQGGVVDDLGRMQGLFDAVKKDVVIDDQWDVLEFAQQASNLTAGNVQFWTLPIEGYATRGGEDVNLVDPVKIKAIVQQAIGVGPASPSPSVNAPPPAPSPVSSPVPSLSPSPTPTASVDISTSGPQGAPVTMGGIPCVD